MQNQRLKSVLKLLFCLVETCCEDKNYTLKKNAKKLTAFSMPFKKKQDLCGVKIYVYEL